MIRKIKFFIGIVCTFCFLSLSAQNSKTVSVNFNKSDFQLTTESDGYTLISPSKVTGFYKEDATKPEFVPYISNGETIYIQNQTFDKDTTFTEYNYVFIGNNVTIDKPQGPVIISNGTTTINKHKEVIITGGFEVQKGAEFNVE